MIFGILVTMLQTLRGFFFVYIRMNRNNKIVDRMVHEQYKLKKHNQPKKLGEIMRELAVNGIDSRTDEVSILSRLQEWKDKNNQV